MLLIPEAALPELWRRVGLDEPERPEELAYTSFPTDNDLMTAVGGEIVPVDEDGHFRLMLTGPHLICHLRASVSSGSPSGTTSGCDLVDLPGSAALIASSGEGGFHAHLEESSASTDH